MIPKVIHQIWYQGEENIPPKHSAFHKQWKIMHSNWIHKFWDETSMLQLLSKYPKYLNTYQEMKLMHQKIDFFKYVLLFDQGGVYVDMDTIPLKPIDGLLNKYSDAEVIVSYIPIDSLESLIISGRTKMVNNGIIMSIRKHHFLFHLLEDIVKDHKCKLALTDYICISRTTGPHRFSKIALKYQNDPTVKILPPKYLEPCYQYNEKCKITEDAYINHEHSQTWLPNFVDVSARLYYKIKNNIFKILAAIISFVFIFHYLRQK